MNTEPSETARRAGYRLEAAFECYNTKQFLWLPAMPVIDGDEIKFRSEQCPECGSNHWTKPVL